jgi:hypothetical protein
MTVLGRIVRGIAGLVIVEWTIPFLTASTRRPDELDVNRVDRRGRNVALLRSLTEQRHLRRMEVHQMLLDAVEGVGAELAEDALRMHDVVTLFEVIPQRGDVRLPTALVALVSDALIAMLCAVVIPESLVQVELRLAAWGRKINET